MPIENYGNDRRYIIDWLYRKDFALLAQSVAFRELSARFAKELARTVPREHLEEVTRIVIERFGGRRPSPWFGWEDFLDIARRCGWAKAA
jgi:hypothetical protein